MPLCKWGPREWRFQKRAERTGEPEGPDLHCERESLAPCPPAKDVGHGKEFMRCEANSHPPAPAPNSLGSKCLKIAIPILKPTGPDNPLIPTTSRLINATSAKITPLTRHLQKCAVSLTLSVLTCTGHSAADSASPILLSSNHGPSQASTGRHKPTPRLSSLEPTMEKEGLNCFFNTYYPKCSNVQRN